MSKRSTLREGLSDLSRQVAGWGGECLPQVAHPSLLLGLLWLRVRRRLRETEHMDCLCAAGGDQVVAVRTECKTTDLNKPRERIRSEMTGFYFGKKGRGAQPILNYT